MTEINGTWGGGLDVRSVSILEAIVGHGGINFDQDFIKGRDHRVVCMKEK